jgi:phosphate-selective porin OprO/OprP
MVAALQVGTASVPFLMRVETVLNAGKVIPLFTGLTLAVTAPLYGQTALPGQAPNNGAAAAVAPEQELRLRISDLERQLRDLKERLAAQTGQGAPSTTSEPSAAAPTLEDRLDALDQRLRILAREDEIRREAQAEAAKTAPTVSAGRDGFQLRSSDGAFALRLRGLVQSDNRFFVDDSTQSAVDTFVLRRVRPIIEATLFRNFDFRITPDFGNGTTVVQDAYLDLRFATGFRVRAGKQKQPFGLERLVSASDLAFVERALPTAVAGNRDVGVMAYGDLFQGRLSYSGGAFNGVVDGSSADVDDRDGKDLVARLFSHPFRTSTNERLQGLGVGVAASYGTQRGSAAVPALASYRSPGQQVFFRYLADGTGAGTAIADGGRRRLSAQGYYYTGRLGVLAEHVVSEQRVRRGVQVADATATSWQLASSWVLSGERAGYRGVTPRTSLDHANGTWGAFELTARYNQLSLGDEVFPVFASAATSAKRARSGGVGLNWYMNRNVKVVFNYEQTHFLGGAPSGDRNTERAAISRVQFSF